MIIPILVSALSGFCAKISDEASERKILLPSLLPYLSSILYGLGLAYLCASSELSSLYIALAIASILAGKIDHKFHIAGLFAFALVMVFLPLGQFDVWFFSLFLALGLLDELEINLGKFFRFLSEQRIFVPFGALMIFLYGGSALFILSILSFDIAYRIGGYASKKLPNTKI